MMERYDPLGRMMSLRQMMDRLLENAVIMPRDDDDLASLATAPVDVYEQGENLVVEAHIPGVKPEDIDISIERGMLTIRAEVKADEEHKDRNYLIREHRQGSFIRRLRLPDTVNPDACQANFDNGVLRLVFPKAEQAKRRRVSIGSGGRRASQSNGQSQARAQGEGQTATNAQRGEHSGSSQEASSGAQSGARQEAASGSRSGGEAS